MATVKVQAAGTYDHGWKTVNIVASDPGTKLFPVHTQTASTGGKTVQASGGTVAGLQTIVIVGYSGPA